MNLLRIPIAASRARSRLAYRVDMSRRSLRGSWRSGLLATIYSQPLSGTVFIEHVNPVAARANLRGVPKVGPIGREVAFLGWSG